MSAVTALRRPGAASAAPGSAIRTLALAALAVEIVIHGELAPDHLLEVPYIGVGFVLASVLLLGVAVGIVVRPAAVWVWVAGAAVCTGMAAAFVTSRTIGLPDLHEAWTSDGGLGLWSLPFEALFVSCAARACAVRPRR